MEEIIQWDWNATLALNDWGNDYVDAFFNFITHKLSAIPLYVFLLYILYKKYTLKQLVLCLICIAILVLLSDQLANLFKDGVQRYRPFREPDFMGQISKVGRSAGTYGFYSGHASNSVALAVFMWLLLREKLKWVGILMLTWAVFVAYSRVYLGVHYLGDVVMGSAMGAIIAFLIFKFFTYCANSKKFF